MRFRLDLGDGRSIEYGLDLAVGADWFAEYLDQGGRVIGWYDAQSPGYDPNRPLRGLLEFLGRTSELFDDVDIDQCALLLVHTHSDELPNELLVLGKVITNLRAAADVG